MSSARMLFYVTLMLLVSFTFSFAHDLGLIAALPWIVASWMAWGLGIAWVRGRGAR